MASEIQRKWILNHKNQKVAPYTMVSQVLDDTSGTGLDIILKKILLETNTKFENLFFFSEEIQSTESETQAFKRLLKYGQNKVIVLDKSLQLTEDVVIPSNISIVGAHSAIILDCDETKKTNHLIFRNMENTKISNLTIKIPLSYSIGNGEGGYLTWSNCSFENITFNCEGNLEFYLYGTNTIFKNCYFKGQENQSKQTFVYRNLNTYNQVCLFENNKIEYFNNIVFGEKNNIIKNLYLLNDSNFSIESSENCYYQNIYLENCMGQISLTDCFNNIIEIFAKKNYYSNDSSLDQRDALFNIVDCEGNSFNLRYDNSEIVNSYEYGVKINKKNTSNKMSIENLTALDTNALILKDYWTSSDLQDSTPLRLDLTDINQEEENVQDLGNGYYNIQSNNQTLDLTIPIRNFMIKDTGMMKNTYPIYFKVFNNNQNAVVTISCKESGSPSAKGYLLYEDSKNSGVSLTSHPYITLKLSGNFNDVIISLKTILSESNYKVDIPSKQSYEE